MFKSILYSVFAMSIFGLIEGGLWEFNPVIRITALILYFPFIFMIFRIAIRVMFEVTYPVLRTVEDYFDEKEKRRLDKKYGFK